jgi:basic membrane protein A and related proteins
MQPSFQPPPLLIVLLLLLGFSACQPSIRENTRSAARPAIAVVLPGAKDDNSWSAAAYRALQAEAKQGARIAWSENVADTEVAQVLQAYVDQGFRIIVAHSYSYQDAVFELATRHPAVHFAWPGGIGRTARNVADYDQPFYEAAYLVGILAGAVSPSGNLGAVYGFATPACQAMGQALLAGAITVNPLARLSVSETADWSDVSKATATALAQAQQQGVDFWIACGEGPASGTIAAARTTGGLATGYASDMTQVAPDVVLVSMVWQLEPLFEQLAQATAAGNFQGAFYRLGLADDAVDLVINPALQPRIPPAAWQSFQQTRTAVRAGRLHVPYNPR